MLKLVKTHCIEMKQKEWNMLQTIDGIRKSPLSFEIFCVISVIAKHRLWLFRKVVEILKNAGTGCTLREKTLALNELNTMASTVSLYCLCLGRTYHFGHGDHLTLTSSFPLKTFKRSLINKINK